MLSSPTRYRPKQSPQEQSDSKGAPSWTPVVDLKIGPRLNSCRWRHIILFSSLCGRTFSQTTARRYYQVRSLDDEQAHSRCRSLSSIQATTGGRPVLPVTVACSVPFDACSHGGHVLHHASHAWLDKRRLNTVLNSHHASVLHDWLVATLHFPAHACGACCCRLHVKKGSPSSQRPCLSCR